MPSYLFRSSALKTWRGRRAALRAGAADAGQPGAAQAVPQTLLCLWPNTRRGRRAALRAGAADAGQPGERGQYLNASNTFQELFAYGTVPVVNENDTVAVEELRFGDNDTLSAQARRGWP